MSDSDHDGVVPLLENTEEDPSLLSRSTRRRHSLVLRQLLQRTRDRLQPGHVVLPYNHDDDNANKRSTTGVSRGRQVSRRSRSRLWSLSRSVVFQIIVFLLLGALIFGILAIEAVVNKDAGLFLAMNLFLKTYFNFKGSHGMRGAFTGSLSNFTKGIVPVPCHSHNDYWRTTPLFDAIGTGCTSVEADVWLFDEDLYVGHTISSLTHDRTLNSLYINSLVDLLDTSNPPIPTTRYNRQNSATSSIFQEDPDQTLVLLIDFKTDGHKTFPVVQKQLEPLRRRNYLTFWDGDAIHPGAITVVGTGNTPFDLVNANSTYRDIFFDAPLANEEEQHDEKDNQSFRKKYNPDNSYYASVSLRKAVGPVVGHHLSPRQLDIIRAQISTAKHQGLHPRYWDTPAKPVSLRHEIWRVLLDEGVDMLNVDDLKDAAEEIRKWERNQQ